MTRKAVGDRLFVFSDTLLKLLEDSLSERVKIVKRKS